MTKEEVTPCFMLDKQKLTDSQNKIMPNHEVVEVILSAKIQVEKTQVSLASVCYMPLRILNK